MNKQSRTQMCMPNPIRDLLLSLFAYSPFSIQGISPPHLIQQSRLIRVQHIHHIAQLLDRLERRLIRAILLRLIEYNQHSIPLVQHPAKRLVQNHPAKLRLHIRRRQTNKLGDVVDFDAGERLDYADEVLLKEGIIEGGGVGADEGVVGKLNGIVVDSLLKLRKRAVLVRLGHGLHGVHVPTGIFERLLAEEDRVDVVGLGKHDFREEHVFEGLRGLLGLLLGREPLEGFDKVGEGGIVVAIFRVQDSGLHVQPRLHKRRAVNRIGRRPRRGKSRAGLGNVAKGVVDAGFEQLDFDEHHLVIEAFELLEETVDEGEGFLVGLLLDIKAD